jgi:hypothetical protein
MPAEFGWDATASKYQRSCRWSLPLRWVTLLRAATTSVDGSVPATLAADAG